MKLAQMDQRPDAGSGKTIHAAPDSKLGGRL